jgi:MFS family permease
MSLDGKILKIFGKKIFPGWYIVVGHMAVHFYMSIAFIYGMGAFMKPITLSMGWTRTQFSIAAGLQRIEGSIATPFIGFIVDRYGPRLIIIFGSIVACIGILLLSRIQLLSQFYAAYIVIALGMSCMIGVPFTAAVANWFNRLRGRAMGVLFSGPIIAGPFMPILILIIELFGWRQTLVILAFGAAIVGIIAGLFARHTPEPYGYLPDGDELDINDANIVLSADPASLSASEKSVTNNIIRTGLSVREALRTKTFWILTIALGLHSMGPSAMFLHQIPYFESIGFTSSQAASTFASFTLLSGIGRLSAGWLLDFIDRRIVLIVLIISGVLGLLILAYVTEYWHSVLYAFFFGISFGMGIPSRPLLCSVYFGTRSFGAIAGLMQSLSVVAGVAAPVIMGWQYDSSGSYKSAVLLLAVLTSLGLPLVFLLPKSRRQ